MGYSLYFPLVPKRLCTKYARVCISKWVMGKPPYQQGAGETARHPLLTGGHWFKYAVTCLLNAVHLGAFCLLVLLSLLLLFHLNVLLALGGMHCSPEV